MPELPEVETIVRALDQGGRGGLSILGWEVDYAQVLWARTIAEPGVEEFKHQIQRKIIRSVNRRAKFIVINLEDLDLIIHLRMSGDIRVEREIDNERKEIPFLKHDRLSITFVNRYRLVFNDTRKFGRVWLVKDLQAFFGELGPEPLDPGLTPHYLHQILTAHNRKLKPLLLDQKFLAGLGNIYADEILYRSKLNPLESSNHLSELDAMNLLIAIREVLNEAILRNGASIDWVYRGGGFQDQFRVYQRTGKPCLTCGALIERLVIGQRSAHFCPECQPLRRRR